MSNFNAQINEDNTRISDVIRTRDKAHISSISTRRTSSLVTYVRGHISCPDANLRHSRRTSDQTLDRVVELHTATVGRISDPVLSGIEALLSVGTSRLARISLSVNTDTAGVIFTSFIGHHTLAGSQV